jgi:hypothetical protein
MAPTAWPAAWPPVPNPDYDVTSVKMETTSVTMGDAAAPVASLAVLAVELSEMMEAIASRVKRLEQILLQNCPGCGELVHDRNDHWQDSEVKPMRRGHYMCVCKPL